jgi:hypothetical protein
MAKQTGPRKQRESEHIAARIASDLLEGRAETAGQNQAVSQALQVFVVHQDLNAGLRAKQTLDDIRRLLDFESSLHLHWWRIELLEDSGLRREAVDGATRADIVFLSLHGDRPLPASLCHWFEQWTLGRREEACVVVVSFDERHRFSDSARKVLEGLHTVAAAGGLEVTPHFAFTPVENRPSLDAGPAWNCSQARAAFPGSSNDTGRSGAPTL